MDAGGAQLPLTSFQRLHLTITRGTTIKQFQPSLRKHHYTGSAGSAGTPAKTARNRLTVQSMLQSDVELARSKAIAYEYLCHLEEAKRFVVMQWVRML